MLKDSTTITTTSSILCCQPWSYLTGHEPHLPTPSYRLRQNLMGWIILIVLKLNLVSASASSKKKIRESGSHSSKSRTQKPGNEGTQSPELLHLQSWLTASPILNSQKHNSSCLPGLLDYSPHWAQQESVATYCSRKQNTASFSSTTLQLLLSLKPPLSSCRHRRPFSLQPHSRGDGCTNLKRNKAWRHTYEVCLWILFIFSSVQNLLLSAFTFEFWGKELKR